jgi:hypothetical protein
MQRAHRTGIGRARVNTRLQDYVHLVSGIVELDQVARISQRKPMLMLANAKANVVSVTLRAYLGNVCSFSAFAIVRKSHCGFQCVIPVIKVAHKQKRSADSVAHLGANLDVQVRSVFENN